MSLSVYIDIGTLCIYTLSQTHTEKHIFAVWSWWFQRKKNKKTPQPAPKKTEQFVLKKYRINTNFPRRNETPQSFPGNKFLSKNVLEVLEVLHQEGNGKLCVPNQKVLLNPEGKLFRGLPPRMFIICLGVKFVFKIPISFFGWFFMGCWSVFFRGWFNLDEFGVGKNDKKQIQGATPT